MSTPTITCPDCDSVLPSTAGIYPCPECNTRLIVTVDPVTEEVTVRVKERVRYYTQPEPSNLRGVQLEYDPGWLPDPVVPLPPAVVGCIHCGLELQSTVGSIRGRILKGLTEVEREGDIDPTTGSPVTLVSKVPMYMTGRIGRCCLGKLSSTVGDKPPKYGEFEYLHERVTLRQREIVTVGMIKAADRQDKIEREALRFEDLGDVIVKAVDELPEPVDVMAYRALYRMKGRKEYKGSYDADSNSSNSSVRG